MGRKLISLNFTPSTELPELGDLRAFLTTDLGRHLRGFTLLESDAKWADLTLEMVGRDGNGQLTLVFPAVARQERELHDVISRALLASTWLEDNADEVTRRYADRGANLGAPLRMILMAPSLVTPSRALARALARAGVEMMPYTIYEIETGSEPVLALSFNASGGSPPTVDGATAGARGDRHDHGVETAPSGAAGSRREPSSANARDDSARAEAAPSGPAADSAAPSRPPTVVEAFVLSLPDPTLRAMSQRVLGFLMTRFPTAKGVVNAQDRGFTLTVGADHLATIRFDKNALWLEVGVERIPTNKIKDPATLERAMHLPSVLDALGSVHHS